MLNCLDRWLEVDAGRCALRWEGEDGEVRNFSYAVLDAEVGRLAGALLALGLRPGEVVGVYLPNLPQAAFALLAIAKIGAIALPLFSGFGADALVTRLADARALDAEAPLLLIYTSGTTGRPKGVVHSHVGFGLKLALDLGLCLDFKREDRILWMADMGWLVGP